MSESHDFWEDLLLAWLHDPFDKALAVQGHESRARRYASAALGEHVSRRRLHRLVAQADVFAAVAERVPLPTAGPDGLRAVGPEDGLRIVHPCSGASADLRPCSLDPDRAAAVIGKLVGGLSGPRERFLAIWRLLPDAVAVEFGDDMARLPADTRIPDRESRFSVWLVRRSRSTHERRRRLEHGRGLALGSAGAGVRCRVSCMKRWTRNPRLAGSPHRAQVAGGPVRTRRE